MTCALRARYSMPGLPSEALDRLERHAATCEECAQHVDLQRKTRALMHYEVEPLDRFERVRLWARIDAARRDQRRPWMAWAALAMSTLAVVLLLLRFEDGEKEVAVGSDNLAFMTDKDGNKYLYTTFTKEQLDAAPTYDKSSWAEKRDEQRLTVTR